MELTPVVVFLAAFALMVPARMYLRRYLLMRGARTVIGRLQEHNAVAEAVARTPETLGLRVEKPFGRKGYQVMRWSICCGRISCASHLMVCASI